VSTDFKGFLLLLGYTGAVVILTRLPSSLPAGSAGFLISLGVFAIVTGLLLFLGGSLLRAAALGVPARRLWLIFASGAWLGVIAGFYLKIAFAVAASWRGTFSG
jgi:hypothetical protein